MVGISTPLKSLAKYFCSKKHFNGVSGIKKRPTPNRTRTLKVLSVVCMDNLSQVLARKIFSLTSIMGNPRKPDKCIHKEIRPEVVW